MINGMRAESDNQGLWISNVTLYLYIIDSKFVLLKIF